MRTDLCTYVWCHVYHGMGGIAIMNVCNVNNNSRGLHKNSSLELPQVSQCAEC